MHLNYLTQWTFPIRLKQILHRFDAGGLISILDQAVTSGTRFLTSIVVSRACGVEQFGYYVLVFTILIHTELVIKSLVSSPFTVFANRFRGGRLARYTANTLIQLVTLASAASGIVLLLTWLLWSAGLGQSLIRPLAALAVAIPFTQLREFARRVAFARLKPTRALALDLAVSVVQLLLLYTLWHLAVLHPGAAYAAIGVACGVVAIPWFLWTQSERRLEPRGCRTDWVRNWKFGKWVLAGLTTHQLTWSAANGSSRRSWDPLKTAFTPVV